MDDFSRGSENLSEQGLDSLKENGRAVAQKVGKVAQRGIRNGARKATKGVRSAIKKGVRKVAASAAKVIAQIGTKIIAALGPVGIVVLAILLVVGLGYVYTMEERGSVESNVMDPVTENPTYMDPETGIMTAVAQTEPQAVVDAYYKYMSVASYVKTFKKGMWEFQEPEETEDFAGLRDYNKLEENFYLSDDFIRQLDELLHDNEFFYPEQLIKPVYGQNLTLVDENGTDKTVYTSRLPFDTPGGERMLDDEQVDGFSDMLSPNNGPLEAPGATGDDKQLLARSQAAEETVNEQNKPRFKLQDRNVIKDDDSIPTEPGLWDYGFASVLDYQADQKLMYINCNYDSTDVDFDVEKWEVVDYDEDGKEIYGWVHYHEEVKAMSLSGGLDALKAACQEYCDANEDEETRWHYHLPSNISAMVDNTVAWNMAKEPNSVVEANYTSIYGRDVTNTHIDMETTEAWDYDIDHLSFKDSSLQSAFGNKGGGLFPLKIAVISHAATFSGNIDYTIIPAGTDGCLKTEAELQPNSSASKNQRDPVQTVQIGNSGCEGVTLTAHRTGTYTTELPKITEKTAPWGFSYLEDYADYYRGFVPEDIQQDLDFFVRTGLSAPEGSEVKEKYKQNLQFLMQLGLLRLYTGNVTLGAIGTVDPSTMGNSDSDLYILAKVIAAEAGPNKLDELMVGSVFVNRVFSSRYPNTFYEVLSAPGQYACFTDGNYAKAQPTDREIASAIQVLTGQFTIPENLTGQSAKIQGNIYKMVDNPSYLNDHYYCTMGYSEAISTVDRYGRPAPDASQLESLAASLEAASSVDASAVEAFGDASQSFGFSSVDGSKILTDYTLYDISAFDVLQATNMQAKLVQPTSGIIAVLNSLWNTFTNAIDQIKMFFTEAIPDVFNTPQKETCVKFGLLYNGYDIKSVVYHSITFANQVWFSTVDAMGDKLEEDGLMFLFVGKNNLLGFGTLTGNQLQMVHGVGTTVNGMISPTTAYYTPLKPYSPVDGYMEMSTPSGTNILAVADGTIVDVCEDAADPAGKHVTMTATIDGDTYEVTFGYLETIATAAGRTVSQGDLIGTSGSKTYLSVKKNGSFVDPNSIFYQSTLVSGPSLGGNLYNADGTVNKEAIAALEAELTTYVNSGGGIYHTRPNNTLSYKQCTWWAWGRGLQYIRALGLPISTEQYRAGVHGNGGQYASVNAASGMFNYGNTPKPNSLVCYQGNPGHVAYVEAVDYVNKKYYTSEAGSGTSWYGIRERPFGYVGHGSGGTYSQGIFIYLDEPR